ncbi:hypothetical protein EON67_06725 [archaeon]|nr:MAG: hypothetical protein EON67_06725 [archaeon]
MQEVPVTWHEVAGSKVDLVSASLQMARDIVVIRMCYFLGIWSDTPILLPPIAGVKGGETLAQTHARVPRRKQPVGGGDAPRGVAEEAPISRTNSDAAPARPRQQEQQRGAPRPPKPLEGDEVAAAPAVAPPPDFA